LAIIGVIATLFVIGVIASSNDKTTTANSARGSSIPKPKSMPTTDYNPPISSDKDDIYLTDLRDEDSYFAVVPNKTLIDLGHSICMEFDDGATTKMILAIGIYSNVPPTQVGEVVGYAVMNYCPEYTEKVYNEVKSHAGNI